MTQDIEPPGPESERAAPAETAPTTLISTKDNPSGDRLKVSAIVALDYDEFDTRVEARLSPSQPDLPDREFVTYSEARAWALDICTVRGWLLVDRCGEVLL